MLLTGPSGVIQLYHLWLFISIYSRGGSLLLKLLCMPLSILSLPALTQDLALD